MDHTASDVTRLLDLASRGDASASVQLFPLVYDELKRLAASQLRRERPDHTLGPTALVHEAYLRLVDRRPPEWAGRSHFFRTAATAMRHILVDHARRRTAQRRSRQQAVTLEDGLVAATGPAEELLAVHEALERLAAIDERQVRLIELRYFGGLSLEAAAEALQVSPATVKRTW